MLLRSSPRGAYPYFCSSFIAQDYYPFGMLMPGRVYTSSDQEYDYGFNGEYRDDDVKGAGVQYDYGFRIYDTRIAKFLSVDPLTASFPWYTPYQFAGNTPIAAIDLDGLEELIVVNYAWKNSDGTILSHRTSASINNFGDPNYLNHSNLNKYGTRGTLNVLYLESPNGGYPTKVNFYVPPVPEDAGNWFTNLFREDKKTGGYSFTIEYDGYLMGQGEETRKGEGEIINIGNLLAIFGNDGALGGSVKLKWNLNEWETILKQYEALDFVLDGQGYVNDIIETVSEKEATKGKPVDSLCNFCDKEPHGLEYRRFNIEGEVIDTVKPAESKTNEKKYEEK